MRLSERLWSMRISLDDLTDDELATFDEAVALARRVEEAPIGTLEDVVDRLSYVNWGFSSGDSFPGAPKLRTMDGKRVRIVQE